MIKSCYFLVENATTEDILIFMKILLTNDDGYGAPGIEILKNTLREGGHDVWVCAPSQARSSTSQSMTFHGEIYLEKYSDKEYACSGYPADCIIYGINSLLPKDFDVVVSGINRGYNNSSDIHYSGTCGAAKEASLMGYRAIAISAEKSSINPNPPYEKAAHFLLLHLETFVSQCWKDHYININVPMKGGVDDYGSATAECIRVYQRTITTTESDDGRLLCHIEDNGIIERNRCSQSDVSLTEQGKIAVSCIQIAPSCSKINI